MTPAALLDDLLARSVAVTAMGDSIELDAPPDALNDADIANLRECKTGVIRLLRLAEGLPVDDAAARLLVMDEVDPADVPICDSCGRYCDVQTLDDAWHCTPCDPEAEPRKQRTERLLKKPKPTTPYGVPNNGR